jgi:hypothetical protein
MCCFVMVSTEIMREREELLGVWEGGEGVMSRAAWENTVEYFWQLKGHVYVSVIKGGRWRF